MRRPLALSAVLLAASPVSGLPPPQVEVTLVWSPTGHPVRARPPLDLRPFQGRTFVLAPFTDARADPAVIGERRFGPDGTRPVTTRDPVPDWVTACSRDYLTVLGLPLADHGPGPVVRGRVTRFFVAEGPGCRGEVEFKVQVEKAGRTVWNGTALGTARRPAAPGTWQDTLSDSLRAAWADLLGRKSFQEGLAR